MGDRGLHVPSSYHQQPMVDYAHSSGIELFMRPNTTALQGFLPQPPTYATPIPTEISDTVALRQRIAQQFEMASIPGTPDADK